MTEFFLHKLYKTLHKGDLVLIGFDLCKDISLLMRAYNDDKGLTRAFNFNVLERLNYEFGAQFNINKFVHYPTYNVHTQAMESYLVSKESQDVYISKLNKIIHFEKIEPIHIECSYKYRINEIENLAKRTGFDVIHHFLDNKENFIDTLWQV